MLGWKPDDSKKAQKQPADQAIERLSSYPKL